MVIVNKCDDMYLNDNGDLTFSDPEFQGMFEQVKNVISNKKNELYPDLTYDVIRMSSEDAYIYRMYEENPDNDLDMKYVNRFGYNEFGKANFNKMKEQEKRNKIKSYMESISDHIVQRMQFNGFYDFMNNLAKTLNKKGQYHFLMNHIGYCLSKIKESDKMLNEDDLYQFIKVYDRINEINTHMSIDVSKNQGINMFNNHLNEYMSQYIKLHVEQYLEEINPANVEMAESNAEYLVKYIENFESEYCINVHRQLQDNINEYYSSNIENKKHGFAFSFTNLLKLLSHGYIKIKNLIKPLLDNDDIMNYDSKYIVESLTKLRNSGLLTEKESDEKSKDILIKIYKAINANRVIAYINKDVIPSYVFCAHLYWSNRDVTDDKHIELQFWAYKNMVKFINENNNSFTNCSENMLESHLLI